MSEADDLQTIPPEFWAPFCRDDAVAEMRDANVRRKLFSDGSQTYEDWERGDFAVLHADGRREEYRGVMINRADLERAFPTKH